MPIAAGDIVTADALNEATQAGGRGIMTAPQGSPTLNSAIAAGFGTTEALWLATTAIATEAGRRYAIRGRVRITAAAVVTVEIRIRRGNGVAGVIVGLYDQSTENGSVQFNFDAPDEPGAQAAQRWSITYKTTSGTATLANPSLLYVEDIGAL